MNTRTIRADRRRREWAQRRETILTAAAELFSGRGFDGVTVQDIANASGFSVGYLYKQFSSKQALIEALYEQEFDLYDRLVAALDEEPGTTPLGRYRREAECLCGMLQAQRPLVAVLAAREPLLSPALRGRQDEYREQTVELLREAIRAGELPPTEVRFLAALLDGVLWSLCLEIATHRPDQSLLEVPALLDALILDPLRRGSSQPSGKETVLP